MNQSNLVKQRRFFNYFLLGFFIGCLLGLSFRFTFDHQSDPPNLSVVRFEFPFVLPHLNATLILLTVAGACGGALYAMRNKELVPPHMSDSVINPGWLGDCFFGVAGAYVISLIVPGKFPSDITSTESSGVEVIIQVLATGIIGGYGGRSIIDRALDNIVNRQDKLENKQEKLKDVVENKSKETEAIKEQVREVKQKDLSGAAAVELLEQYLDEDLGLPGDQLEQFKQAIKAASSSLQARIFLEAKKVLAKNLRNSNLEMIKRTILVFEALVENDTENRAHRNHAQLGYAFEGIKEWKRAEEQLIRAISIRDKANDQNESFRIYELHRAVCRINLDENYKKQQASLPSIRNLIVQDLRSAFWIKNAATRIKSNAGIQDWLQLNNLSLKDLESPA